MLKKSFLLAIAILLITSVSFSQNYFGWGYKTLDDGLNLPYNWTQESIVGDALWYGYGGLYTPYEGGGNKYFCVWAAVGNDIGEEAIIITEAFDNTGIDNTFIGFWHHQVDFGGDNNELEVYYRTSPTSDWVLLQAFADPIADWTEESLYFPEQSATMQVGFKGILIGGDNTQGAALDFVSLQWSESNCFAPTNLNADNLTTSSASITWTEVGSATTWEIEFGVHGFSQGDGTIVTGITPNPEYVITDLDPNFQYDVYVRTDCGDDEYSEWTGPFSFYTDYPVITDFPYLEAFNNEDFDDDDWIENLHVNGWTEDFGHIDNPTILKGDESRWVPREFGNEQDYNPENANCISLNLFGNTYSWLISPTFDIATSADYCLEFDVAFSDVNGDAQSFSGLDTLAVIVSTDAGQTWNKDNIIHLWDANTNASEITPEGIHKVIDLGSYTGEIKISFYASGESFNYTYVDNIEFSVLTGINKLSGNEISIYPNPTTGIVNLELFPKTNNVTITDITGKIVFSSKNSVEKQIDISNLESGIYFIRIQTGDKLITKRVIKQ